MSGWSVNVEDLSGLKISASQIAVIQNNVTYVMSVIDEYADWKGSIEVAVRIKTHAQKVADYAQWGPEAAKQADDIDGLVPSITGAIWTGSYWTQSIIYEAVDGIDRNGSSPDAGMTIYLGRDNTFKNYGSALWFDPAPKKDVQPNIPQNMHDFVSIALHEILHGLAYDNVEQKGSPLGSLAKQISENIFSISSSSLTNLLGQPLYLDASNHIITSRLPDHVPYSASYYDRDRWDISRIDLMLMKDLGWTIIDDLSGLPYYQIDDKNPIVNGTNAAEILYGDYHNNVMNGFGGNDQLFGGQGNDFLFGGAGNDRLYGEEGDDTLEGGAGDDILNGDEGSDTAIFSGIRAQYILIGSGANITVGDRIGNRDGTDTLFNVEFLRFSDQTISTNLSPIYTLSASSVSVNEGSTATFTLTTTNVAAGTQVAYTLSGVSAADVQGGALSGTATVGANGQATISVVLLADSLTEGAEVLTLTAAGKTASKTVNDTSISSSTVQPGTSGNDTFREPLNKLPFEMRGGIL
jgi:Ca2+-binding RTX toxin-like protein